MKNKAQVLQISAFAVAIARYMALGGMAVGHNVFASTLFVWLEIISWAAMAVLEGFAIPYISKGMSRFVPKTFYWWQLLVYRILLLLAIPLLGAPLYAAVSAGVEVYQVLYIWQYWVWLFLFSGLVALIVDGVGVVEGAEPPPEQQNPGELVYNAIKQVGVQPAKIAKQTGLPIAVVDDELSAVARLFSVNGKG